MRRKRIIYFGILLLIFYIFLQSMSIYTTYIGARNELGQTAVTMSKVIANNVNSKEYEEIANKRIKDENYYKLQQKVKDLKNISGAKYVYIERKITDGEIEYIIDADSDIIGEKDINEDNMSFDTTESTSIGTNSSKWGELITGFTPILDDNKNVIGLVGVDYEFGMNVLSVKNTLIATLKSIGVMSLFLLAFVGILFNLNISKNREVMKFYGDIVHSLMIMLNKKSDYTGKHSENVAILSESLAQKFFKNEKKLETVRWASLLHDIGKIGIPGDILDKPGKLTDEEFIQIKKHPIYSKEMLEKIFTKENALFSNKEINIISDIAKYHHERWDGKGYPCGLKGEEIPFMARIVSVSDAYEAMTAERPYKKPMSKEKAVEIIVSCSGTQFDPQVVEKFLECIQEGKI